MFVVLWFVVRCVLFVVVSFLLCTCCVFMFNVYAAVAVCCYVVLFVVGCLLFDVMWCCALLVSVAHCLLILYSVHGLLVDVCVCC